MKNIKKLFLVFTMVFAVFAVTACSGSSLNKVHNEFIEAGYHRYEYKNTIAVNFNLDREIKVAQGGATTSAPSSTSTIDKISTTAMFQPIDRLSLELRSYILAKHDIVDKAFKTKTTYTPNPDPDLKVIDGLKYDVYIYGDYEKLNESDVDSKTALIIDFPSEAYLREAWRVSVVLQDILKDYDIEDHINGNLLLLIPKDRVAHYDEIVEIFNKTEK